MAAQYKTRCPHCGAQFKISQEHLKQAGGQVRCGSCLEVFQATEHLVREKAAPAAKRPAPKAPPKKAAAKKTAAPQQKKQPPARKADDEPRWSLPESEEKPPEKKEKQKNPYIEENDTAVSLGESELSESFNTLGEGNDDFGAEDFSDMSGAAGGGDSSADESWAEELLQELGEDDEKPQQQTPVTPDNMSLLDEYDGDIGAEEPLEHAEPPAAEEDDLDFFKDSFGDSQESPETLEEIEVPRQEEEKAPRIPRPGNTTEPMEMVKWGLLSLVAVLLLGGQYLLFNFDHLARTPEWRPLYASACNLLGCELPNPSDISKLRGTNLVVRDHPSVGNALVVDAILFNKAEYDQPFPVLELSFSSLNGRAVASRRFSPQEYRSGELKDMEKMPADVPVHISFEIRDPGEEAVNYSLRFFSAPTTGNS